MLIRVCTFNRSNTLFPSFSLVKPILIDVCSVEITNIIELLCRMCQQYGFQVSTKNATGLSVLSIPQHIFI